jgi:hypothetical protein
MAFPKKYDIEPDKDELSEVRETYTKQRAEKEALQKQTKPQEPLNAKLSSIFLIIAALLVFARLVLFIVVEQWGTHFGDAGDFISVIVAIVVGLMVLKWLDEEWKTEGLTVAGSAIFLSASFVAWLGLFEPSLLGTADIGPLLHPVRAAAMLIICFLLAATPIFRWLMAFLLVFVTNPRRAFEK